MATKNLLGDVYRYEPGEGKKRDAYLAKWGVETFLVVTDTPPSSNSDVHSKRIQFKTDTPTFLSPRVSFADEIPAVLQLRRMNSETKSADDADDTGSRTSSGSMESLYEKLPARLPVITGGQRIRYSLPHIYTVRIDPNQNFLFFYLYLIDYFQ